MPGSRILPRDKQSARETRNALCLCMYTVRIWRGQLALSSFLGVFNMREQLIWLLQSQSLTVTVGYSDNLGETKTITNRFQAVRVTNMLLRWHFCSRKWAMRSKFWCFGGFSRSKYNPKLSQCYKNLISWVRSFQWTKFEQNPSTFDGIIPHTHEKGPL